MSGYTAPVLIIAILSADSAVANICRAIRDRRPKEIASPADEDVGS